MSKFGHTWGNFNRHRPNLARNQPATTFGAMSAEHGQLWPEIDRIRTEIHSHIRLVIRSWAAVHWRAPEHHAREGKTERCKASSLSLGTPQCCLSRRPRPSGTHLGSCDAWDGGVLLPPRCRPVSVGLPGKSRPNCTFLRATPSRLLPKPLAGGPLSCRPAMRHCIRAPKCRLPTQGRPTHGRPNPVRHPSLAIARVLRSPRPPRPTGRLAG